MILAWRKIGRQGLFFCSGLKYFFFSDNSTDFKAGLHVIHIVFFHFKCYYREEYHFRIPHIILCSYHHSSSFFMFSRSIFHIEFSHFIFITLKMIPTHRGSYAASIQIHADRVLPCRSHEDPSWPLWSPSFLERLESTRWAKKIPLSLPCRHELPADLALFPPKPGPRCGLGPVRCTNIWLRFHGQTRKAYWSVFS